MSRHRILLLSLACATLCMPAAAQESEVADADATKAPDVYYQKAWHYEHAQGRIEEALAMYQGLAKLDRVPMSIRAKALFRSGICLRKLQRGDEALSVFRRVAKEFPDEIEVAREAKQQIEGETRAEAVTRRKVDEILVRLITAAREPIPSPFGAAIAELEGIGPRAAPYVLEALSADEIHPAADYLAGVLTRFARSDPQLAPTVQDVLRHGRKQIRIYLLDVQGNVRGESWQRVLKELLGDPDPEIRRRAVRALGIYSDVALLEALRPLLKDTDTSVRVAVMEALEITPDPKFLPDVESACADPEPAVRQAATRALGKILLKGDVQEVDLSPVLKLLDDPSIDVFGIAIQILYQLQSNMEPHRARAVFPGGEDGDALVARVSKRLLETEGKSYLSLGSPTGGRLRRVHDAGLRLLLTTERPQALVAYRDALNTERYEYGLKGIELLADPVVVDDLIDLLDRKGKKGKRAWTVLTEKLWGPRAAEAVVKRLPRLHSDYQPLAVAKVLDSGQVELVDRCLAVYDDLDRKSRKVLLSHGSIAAASDRNTTVKTLIRGLDDLDEEVRGAAIKQLRTLARPEDSPSIAALVSRLRPKERVLVLEILARLGNPAVLSEVEALLADTSPNVRAQAVNAVVRIGGGATLPRILGALEDSSSDVRKRAVQALGTMDRSDLLSDPRTLRRIDRIIDDDVEEIRQESLRIFVVIGGQEGLDRATRVLKDQDRAVREAAARAMARLEDPRAVDPLLEAFREEKDSQVRRAIVEALATYRDDRAIPVLVDSFARLSDSLIAAVLHSLERYPAAAVIERLTPVLDSELSAAIKARTLDTLARFDHSRSFDVIVAQLKSPEAQLRQVAVQHAAFRLDPRVLPQLVDLLRDPDASVRQLAQESIDKIRYYEEQQRRLGERRKGTDAMRELLALLKSDVAAVRLAAVQAIARTRAPEALPELVRIRKDPDPAVREAVERALDELTRDAAGDQ